MGVLKLLAGLLLLAPTAWAQNTWTGGAAGDWHVGANWSGGVPGAGADVLIDADSLVVAYATNPAISLSALTLGDGAGTFAPALRLSAGASLGVLRLYPRAALQLDTTDLMLAQDVYLAQGSSIAAWTAASAAGGAASRWDVAGTFDVGAGATVTVAGRGYAPDTGPGAGAPGSVTSAGGGGGHGGAGGQAGGGAAGGAAYGLASSATFAGSGGGTSPSASGGGGGGVIEVAASTLNVSGLLDADGQGGVSAGFEGGGGGAGGSIRLSAHVLTGGGILSARGGLGGTGADFGAGGGGGGRIEVRVAASGDLLVSSATHRVNFGFFGAGATAGGGAGTAGSDFMTPRHWTRGGANALASTAANWSGGHAPRSGERLIWGASETARAGFWDLPDVAVGSVTVLSAYSTSVVLNSSLTVTGLFSMAGGTLTGGSGRALELRGPGAQTGGLINLIGSTVALRGGSYAFFDARSTVLITGGLGAATATVSGLYDARAPVELSDGAHLALEPGTLKLSALTGPFAGPGTVAASSAHVTLADAGLPQVWSAVPGALGGLRVSNASGGLTLSSLTVTLWQLEGGVSVDTGAVLRASGTYLAVGGDWSAYGPAYVAGSTVSFDAQSGTQSVSGSALFDTLRVDAAAAAVTRFSTQVVVGSTLTVASGTLDLLGSTVVVKGGWLELPGTAVRGAGSKAIFDGEGPLHVRQLGSGSFGVFAASAAAGLHVSSMVTALSHFHWHRGPLDIAGREIFVGGDLTQLGPGALSAFLSTVTLNGSGVQTTNLTLLHGLVIDNRSPAGARITLNLSVSSFTIRPGASFDGFNRFLVVTGSWWDTAQSTYNSLGQLHNVQWAPPPGTPLLVGAGSVVKGKTFITNGRTVQLLGDLTIQGAGTSFDPRTGSTLLNAPGGSTLTFSGSADLVPSGGANWTYGGNVADSWLVFEGTGLVRGLFMSTNTLGSVRVAMDTATDTYRAPDMTLLKHLVVEGGSFKPNGPRTITLGGDLIQTASGVVAFASSGTLRMAGASTQTLRLVPSSHTLLYATFDSAGGVRVESDLTVKADFVVAGGTFAAGSGLLSLQGDRVIIATGAYFDAEGSTVGFDGGLNGRLWTGVSFHGGGSFQHGRVIVSSVAFQTHATFTVLTDVLAQSTIAVAPGMTLKVGTLRVDPGGGTKIRLRSTFDGLPWFLELVTVSSVTGCAVSDSDASPGLTVRADDGRCSDLGNNVNWDFAPQLVTVFPGETLTPGVAPGKSGAPDTLTAGSTAAVTVHALSSRWDPIFISSPVAIVSADPWAQFSPSLTLVGGATGFAYSPRTAEPSPLSTVVSAVASFGSGGSTVAVVPDALERLQLILPGETLQPGRPGGKTGVPFARVRHIPFSLTVRAVDRYANVIATVTHTVQLGVSASSSTLPAPAALAGGTRLFTGLAMHVTGFFTLSAADLTEPSVLSGSSAVFGVAPPSISSPTAAFHVPPGARVATLGGAVSGTASDSASVERVTLSLLDATSGLHYDWGLRSFSSAAPQFATATLASPLAPDTTWHALAPDVAFVSGRRYVFTAAIDDPSGFTGAASSTFTFDRSTLDFGLKDGQGSASVLPVSTAGCAVIVATVTFTVGRDGIAPGGAVALRAPEGWTVAGGTTAAFPPAVGYWHVTSTSLAFPSARPTVSPASLGAGWLLLELSTASAQSFLPGERVVFTFAGLPPLSPSGRGDQAFPVLARGEAGGALLSISSFPVMDLAAGVAPVLVFADPSPLSLTPLQLSPTMQFTLEDRCGNSRAGLSSGTVVLSLLVSAPGGAVPDATAQILDAAGDPLASVFLSTGFALSQPFRVRTATTGVPELLVRGKGDFGSNPSVPVEAVRLVRLTTAPLAFTAVAAGVVPLPSGTTSAALSAADPQGVLARVAFRLEAPETEWELVLATGAAGLGAPVLRANGRGEAGRTFVVAWDGVDRVAEPPRYAAPGRYAARLTAGGTAVDTSVEVVVPEGAALRGDLGPRGAGAAVRASGPGAADGAFAVATSTGHFLLRGVRPGQAYLLTASTIASAGGRLVSLSTTVLTGAAAAPWLDLGALSLPATGQLRVAVASPVPAPRELVGAFSVRGADGRVAASGPLRFSSGSAASDDAGPLFGRAASTWSVAPVPEGEWTLEVELPELRLAASLPVAVAAGGSTDARLVPPKRGAVLGWAVLPSTAPFGTLVSVDATRAGAASPSAAAGVFVSSTPPPVHLSSGAFGLYGLDAGTYTVTAAAGGFVAASSTVYVSTGADVPLVLRLGEGASVTGAVRVLGDSTGAGALFDAVVEARAEGRLETARTRVRLGASASLSSGTYALTGLSTGAWTVTASLPGFALAPSTGVRVTAPGAATLDLSAAEGRLRLSLPPLPGGACRAPSAFRSVGLVIDDAAGRRRFIPEITTMSAGGFALTHCSSATVLTPALAPGRATVWAGFLDTGARAFGGAALSAGATAPLTLDLSVATTTVFGRVAVVGEFTLSSRSAGGVPFTVSVSSPDGLNAWAPGPGPVLIGSSSPTPVGAFRAELRPVDSEGRVSTQAAIVTPIRADGSYVFAGVSAGRWSLRVPGELDGRSDDGEEAAPAEAAVAVADSPVEVNVSFGRGAALSGRVSAPGGTRLTRALRVLLAAEDGSAPRRVEASFADADWAPFAFPAVPPGRWRVSVEDPSRPAVWTAAPRLLEVPASGLSGLDLRLESAGAILGRLALARARPDGTQERVLLTAESAELLPAGLSITARALPPAWGAWSADPGLDADGRFLIPGLPAGSYELLVSAPSGLAPASVSGIAVSPGRASDPGTVVLRRAARASGRVLSAATGLPAAGVAVSARPSSRASAAVRAFTDADGLWSLDQLDPDERFYDLTAAPRGAESAADSPAPFAPRRLLGVDASTGVAVDFVLSPAVSTLRGRATTPDGKGLPSGALLTLQRAGLPPEEDPLADLLFRTGADGRFAVPSLATGSYRLGLSAEGYGSLARAVTLTGASLDLGELLLPGGGVLAGALRRPDGAPPSEAEVRAVAAATADLNEFVWGTISREAAGGGVSYRVGGLRTGRAYRLLLITGEDEPVVPPGGEAFVFTSSAEVRGFDAVARPPRPSVAARAERSGGRLTVRFDFSRALRARTPADADPSLAVTRVSGGGLLSGARLSADRRELTVDYDPAAGESAFSLRARAAVAETDPDSADPDFPELVADATAAFRTDVDAQQRAVVANALGGALTAGGDGGRVILPRGAFAVDAASTVAVTFTRSSWNLAGAAPPGGLAAASPFFDISLPPGVGATLARPARLVLPFSAGADPAALSLYWYNPGNGAYVLTPDALGQAPEVDAAARTYAVNVGHFSTYVLLPAGAAVIGGVANAGGSLEAYAFPNPFDLRPKTVTTIHGGGSPTIRGTMLRVAVPPSGGGAGRVRVFDTAGRLVRELSLGELAPGTNYYVDWDGRNSAGADVASGLYLAVVSVGNKSKTVKLAVLK